MEKMTVLPFLESLSNKTTNDQSQSMHFIYIKIDKNRLYVTVLYIWSGMWFRLTATVKKLWKYVKRFAIFCGFKYKLNSYVTGSHLPHISQFEAQYVCSNALSMDVNGKNALEGF